MEMRNKRKKQTNKYGYVFMWHAIRNVYSFIPLSTTENIMNMQDGNGFPADAYDKLCIHLAKVSLTLKLSQITSKRKMESFRRYFIVAPFTPTRLLQASFPLQCRNTYTQHKLHFIFGNLFSLRQFAWQLFFSVFGNAIQTMCHLLTL